MAVDCEPSDPHTTGPMPGVSDGPSTAAPEPSPKMKAMLRSVGSMIEVNRSVPITSTYSALPPRIMSEPSATPWQKPAHAMLRSKAAESVHPSRVATSGPAAGIGFVTVHEATMTAPICSGAIPAAAIALPPAATDMSWIVSPGAAKCRVAMPDRVRIHSSVESMCSQISSLVTRRAGR
jgi:hypothetical protein